MSIQEQLGNQPDPMSDPRYKAAYEWHRDAQQNYLSAQNIMFAAQRALEAAREAFLSRR